MACYVLTFYGQILHVYIVYSTEITDEKKRKGHTINYP